MANNCKWAIFDLDGTLLDGNSFRMLVREIYKSRSVCDHISLASSVVRRKIGQITREELQESVLSKFSGWNKDKVDNWGEQFCHRVLQPRIFPRGMDYCADMKEQGWELILATGALDFYVHALANILGFDHVICTKLKYENNGFNGKIDGRICLGPEKRSRIAHFLSENKISYEAVYGYSDHISDICWLDQVKKPVAVNPNHQFANIARQKGWEIINWDQKKKRK